MLAISAVSANENITTDELNPISSDMDLQDHLPDDVVQDNPYPSNATQDNPISNNTPNINSTNYITEDDPQNNESEILTLNSTEYEWNYINNEANITVDVIKMPANKTVSNETPYIGDVITFNLTVQYFGTETYTKEATVTDELPDGLEYVENKPIPDLSITKISDKDQYRIGDLVTWTFTISNAPNAANATDILVGDTLPNALNLVGNTPSYNKDDETQCIRAVEDETKYTIVKNLVSWTIPVPNTANVMIKDIIFNVFTFILKNNSNYATMESSPFIENDLTVDINYRYLINSPILIDLNISFQNTKYSENLHDLNNINSIISEGINNVSHTLQEDNLEKTTYNTPVSEYNTDYTLNTKTANIALEFSEHINISQKILSNTGDSTQYSPPYNFNQTNEYEGTTTNPSKQFENSNIAHVGETNFIHENKQKNNQNTPIRNHEINLPFNVINTSISALFGLIDITIPEKH